MRRIQVTLTEDQFYKLRDLLEDNIKNVQSFVDKYEMSHEEYKEGLGRTHRYSSWWDYDKSRQPQVKAELAFTKRLLTELAQAKS